MNGLFDEQIRREAPAPLTIRSARDLEARERARARARVEANRTPPPPPTTCQSRQAGGETIYTCANCGFNMVIKPRTVCPKCGRRIET